MEQIKRSLLTLISVTLVIRSAGNIFQPALSYMADDLGITQVEATTNLTLSYFCLTLSFLFFGPICDRFSKNRLLQVSLLSCFLGCILCGSAKEILFFNIGRCIQAFSAGLALLSSQIWIGEQPDKKAMMSRLAWFSIIVSIAPIFSPMVGGFISDWLSWRYDFWLISGVRLTQRAIHQAGQDTADRIGRSGFYGADVALRKLRLQCGRGTLQLPATWHRERRGRDTGAGACPKIWY